MIIRTFAYATLSATLLAGTAIVPAQAQQSPDEQVETAAGAGAGATAGALTGGVLGGPVGAVIGGFTGATLGAAATVPEPVSEYAVANPVEPVYFESNVDIGTQVGQDVQVYDVPDTEQYGYIYANGRAYIVDENNREIVYSPGYALEEQTIAYVESNPGASVNYSDGDFSVGIQLPGEVELTPVPEDPQYSYVYYRDDPVLVETSSRTVVWTGA